MAHQDLKPAGGQSEKRTLASIMFTDVVEFSKLSAIDEERTYLALQRDFDIIRRSVNMHGGEVLNTMGDGMMVYFPSAVEALRCAVEVQKELFELVRNRHELGILRHRIGLHIGDIILNGANSMGDGINQAARIQALAKPDTIAMSDEFHKFVDKKVDCAMVYLGPQRAKNIPENISLWEVPALADEIKQRAAEALFVPPAPVEQRAGVTGRRAGLLILLAMGLIGLSAFMVNTLKNTPVPPAKSNPNGRFSKERLLAGKDPAPTDGTAPGVEDAGNVPEPVNEPVAPAFAFRPSDLEQIGKMKEVFDFEGIADYISRMLGGDSAEALALIKKYQGLAQFKNWVTAEVNAVPESAPLNISVSGNEASVFADQGGVVIATPSGRSNPESLWLKRPETITAIASVARAAPPTGQAPPSEVDTWIRDFQSEFPR